MEGKTAKKRFSCHCQGFAIILLYLFLHFYLFIVNSSSGNNYFVFAAASWHPLKSPGDKQQQEFTFLNKFLRFFIMPTYIWILLPYKIKAIIFTLLLVKSEFPVLSFSGVVPTSSISLTHFFKPTMCQVLYHIVKYENK